MAFQWHPLLNTPWKETMEIWVHQNIPPWIRVDEECIKCKSILLIFSPPPFTRLELAEHKWLFLLTLLRGPFTYLKVICIYTCILHISMHILTSHMHTTGFSIPGSDKQQRMSAVDDTVFPIIIAFSVSKNGWLLKSCGKKSLEPHKGGSLYHLSHIWIALATRKLCSLSCNIYNYV